MTGGIACLNANPCPVIPSVARDLLPPAGQQIPRCARNDMSLVRSLARGLLVPMIAVAVFALAACAHRAPTSADVAWQQARQAVVVVTPDWNADHGMLHTFEQKDGAWHEVGVAQ